MRVPRRSVDAAAALTAPGSALPSRAPSPRTTGHPTGVPTQILADFEEPIQRRTAPGGPPPEWGTTR
ncbi:hypothetical protein Q5530_13695 [Saccharothrix sp. BKS2]|uniref:hypothetical protein n=1 Tax=Saccharothrix sp. BKS2 TaxID=3064400 RepID=UPI0039EBD1D2